MSRICAPDLLTKNPTVAAAQLPIIGNQRYAACCMGVKLLYFEAVVQNLMPSGFYGLSREQRANSPIIAMLPNRKSKDTQKQYINYTKTKRKELYFCSLSKATFMERHSGRACGKGRRRRSQA